MEDEKKSSSKLNDLFADLQETLDNSIYSESGDKTEIPERPKKTEIPEAPKIPKKPEKPEEPEKTEKTEKAEIPREKKEPAPPPVKTYATKAADEKKAEGGKQNDVIWEMHQTGGENEDNSDIDMELLKAIGIGRDENEKQPRANRRSADPEAKRDGDEERSRPAAKKISPKTFYKVTDKEFVAREQINDIFASYRSAYVSELVKVAAGAALFLILFYMELAPYTHWKMPGILNIYYYNMPYIWIDMQLLFLVAALNLKPLIFGVKSMFSSNINIYSIAVLFFAFATGHTLLTLNLRYNSPDMVLYNSIAAYALVMLSLYNLLDISSEITSFKTVSSNKPKFALNLIDPGKFAKSSKSAKNHARPYGSAEKDAKLFADSTLPGSTVGAVANVPFVPNFFAKTYKDKHIGGPIKYFVYISVFVSLALFIVTMGISKQKDWYVALSAVTALFLSSVPLCSFVAEVYPAFRAQKKARAAGAAFIGGKSMQEGSNVPIISVYDRHIFPPEQIRITGIKVYGNNRIDTILQSLCAVFEKLNMAPAESFKATANNGESINWDVNFIGIDKNGICYETKNQKLFIGTGEYIQNLGLTPFTTDVDEAFVKSLGSIMYLCSETEVMAKVYLNYEISPDFYEVIKSIKRLNACLCIRTFDPNIDDALVLARGNIRKYQIKVLKLSDLEDVYETPEKIDAPIVSKESLKSLIGAMVVADRTKTLMKTNVFIQTLSFAAGILLSVILGIAGQLSGINAGHLFLFQSFWMLPMFVLPGIGT